LLAKIVNDKARNLIQRGANTLFASKLAPTIASVTAVTPSS